MCVCVCVFVCVCVCNINVKFIDDVVIFKFAGVRKNSVPSQVRHIDKLTLDVALQLCGNQYPYFLYFFYVSLLLQKENLCAGMQHMFVLGINKQIQKQMLCE